MNKSDEEVKDVATPKRLWLARDLLNSDLAKTFQVPRRFRHLCVEYALVDPSREAAVKGLYDAAKAALSLLSNIEAGKWANTAAGDKLTAAIAAYEALTPKERRPARE